MKKLCLTLALIMSLATATTAAPVADPPTSPDMPPPPANTISNEDFVRQASVANMFEIESSRLAMDKAKSADVKTFAMRMIDHHTQVGDKLKSVLANSKLKPETELDDKHILMLKTLEAAAPGTDFETQYVTMQRDAHGSAVKLFDDYSKSAKDKDLNTFAQQTLPTLKAHLEHVQKLKKA